MAHSFSGSWRVARIQLHGLMLAGLASCGGGTGAVSGPNGSTASSSGPPGSTSSQTVASVSVTPRTSTMNIGQTLQFAAIALNASGTAISVRPVTWRSSDSTVLAVSSTGLATALAAGSASAVATIAGTSGAGSVTVSSAAPVVASVVVTPATASWTVGVKLPLSATVKDRNNNVMAGQLVTWTSNNTAIATVDSTGTTLGIAAGTVTITATVAGVSGTATLTEQTPVAGSGQLYPNQPPGLTRFAEINFSALPDVAGTTGTIAGNFWTAQSASYHMTIVSDPTAPQSPAGVLQMDYEIGTQPGYPTADQSGYRDFGGWTGVDQLSNTEYSQYYESTWFKIPTPDFETQEVGAKMLGYWGVGDNNQPSATGIGPTQLYSMMRGNGSGTSIMSSWFLDMGSQGVASRYLSQNQNLSKKITAGVWHQFETYMKVNDIGSSNGVWKWWLDGVLIGDYENVQFINAASPAGFFGRKMNLIWGGQGGTAKTRTDHVWFDHMYMSGVFLRNPQ